MTGRKFVSKGVEYASTKCPQSGTIFEYRSIDGYQARISAFDLKEDKKGECLMSLTLSREEMKALWRVMSEPEPEMETAQ